MTFTPTVLDRPTADLLSGGLGVPASVSDTQFATLSHACEARLLAMLCMTAPPAPQSDDYDSWLSLLANWIKAVYAVNNSGVTRTVSKSMRNFRVLYGDNGEVALKSFYSNFQDLIGLFSQCSTGVEFQTDRVPLIYAPDSVNPANMFPDNLPMAGGAL